MTTTKNTRRATLAKIIVALIVAALVASAVLVILMMGAVAAAVATTTTEEANETAAEASGETKNFSTWDPEEKVPIGPPPVEGGDDDADTGDDGNVAKACPAILKTMFETDKKTYTRGEDVIVSGCTTAGGRLWGDEGKPVEVRWLGPEDGSYGSNEVQPKYSDCSFSFSFVYENVQQIGTWEMSAVYPAVEDDDGSGGGNVIGKTQFEVVEGEEVLGDDKIDTWINWVRTPDGTDIPNGGNTTSTTVVIDFQGNVEGPGTHIDLSFDHGPYVRVTSPHTITGLSWPGLAAHGHMISLRSVDKEGHIDPTPATWGFVIFEDGDGDGHGIVGDPICINEGCLPPENGTGNGIIGEGLRNPFKTFGDRQLACIDEVMFGLVHLKDKAPTWYEFVTSQTKSIECKTGEEVSYTQTPNVMYNMILSPNSEPVLPEVMIGSAIYTDDNLEWNNYHMAAALVHESMHVDQMHDGRWSEMSRYASERECHVAALDALKQIDAPQYMIDEEQGWIDAIDNGTY